MKQERLFDAITNVRDDLILKSQKRRRGWIPALAAAAAVVLTVTALAFPKGAAPTVIHAAYPEIPPRPVYEDYADFESYDLDEAVWQADYGHYFTYMKQETAESLRPFFATTLPALLEGEGNRVCSPLNLYLALAMLAEVSGGSTQAQLLNLLNAGDTENLRATVREVWEKNYSPNTPKLLLANSVWLSDTLPCRTGMLQTLAQDYFASSYRGKMGSKELNDTLQEWVNEQTGNLLEEQVQNLTLKPETAFALVSTVYMNNNWEAPFLAANTRPETFHSPGGEVTCDFLHEGYNRRPYYWGKHFTATTKRLEDGYMTFLLPDEGHTVEELLQDETAIALLSGKKEKVDYQYIDVSLALPKFDVAGEAELTETIKKIGITEIFESGADFSPLTGEQLAVSQIRHGARVAIDEKGCVGAAYTKIDVDYEAPPPEDMSQAEFVADRPFIFTVCTTEGSVLFAGVVSNP